MRVALYILLAAAALLAWVVARRRPVHGPIAVALSIALGAELARAGLLVLVPARLDPASGPLEGIALLARHVDRALFVAWPFALAAAAVRVLARRRAWPVAIAYAVAVAVLVLGYPALRFGALRRTYLAIELAALLVGVVSIGAWRRRTAPVVRRGEREQDAGSTRIVRVLVLGQAAVVLTTYYGPIFGEAWNVARGAYFAVLGAVVVLHLVEVLRDPDA